VPRRPQALAVLALLTALVVPSAAFGQSAGDEQYTDPFGGDEPQQQEQPPQEQQPEPQQAEAPTGTAEQPAAPAAPSDGGGEVAAPAQATDPSLPVTGLPALALLAVGAGMLAAGLVVRRRA
jgi:hypothetical protein